MASSSSAVNDSVILTEDDIPHALILIVVEQLLVINIFL